MGPTFTGFKREIKRYKNGVMSGAIVGFALAVYVAEKGIMALIQAVEQPGWIDGAITSISANQMLFLKLAIVYITFGAMIGYIMERFILKK